MENEVQATGVMQGNELLGVAIMLPEVVADPSGAVVLNTNVLELDETMGTIAQLNHEGDTKYQWNRKNEAECTAAREHFEHLIEKGFLAFKVKKFGHKGAPAAGFDPQEGKYIFTPPTEDPPQVATTFDSNADYVVAPPMRGG